NRIFDTVDCRGVRSHPVQDRIEFAKVGYFAALHRYQEVSGSYPRDLSRSLSGNLRCSKRRPILLPENAIPRLNPGSPRAQVEDTDNHHKGAYQDSRQHSKGYWKSIHPTFKPAERKMPNSRRN